jgi:hypothetical protein
MTVFADSSRAKGFSSGALAVDFASARGNTVVVGRGGAVVVWGGGAAAGAFADEGDAV